MSDLPFVMPIALHTPSTAASSPALLSDDSESDGDEEIVGDRYTYGACTRGQGDSETILDYSGYGAIVKTSSRFGTYLKQRYATLVPLVWKIRATFRQEKYARTPLSMLSKVTRKDVAWAHGTVWTRGCYYPHASCKSCLVPFGDLLNHSAAAGYEEGYCGLARDYVHLHAKRDTRGRSADLTSVQ